MSLDDAVQSIERGVSRTNITDAREVGGQVQSETHGAAIEPPVNSDNGQNLPGGGA